MMLRLYAILLSALLLSACGFEPMYARKSGETSTSPLLPVSVDPIDAGRMGQLYQIALEDKFNPAGSGAEQPYGLTADITRKLTPVIVRPDGTIQRYNVLLQSKYQLYRKQDKKPLTSGEVHYLTSYNITDDHYSTYVGKNDITANGVAELAENLRLRLSGYFVRHAEGEQSRQ